MGTKNCYQKLRVKPDVKLKLFMERAIDDLMSWAMFTFISVTIM